jgi:excisionase family DNA binding protein
VPGVASHRYLNLGPRCCGEEGGEVMKSERSKSSAKLFTIKEIAECVGVCDRTIRRWIEKGLLVAHDFNGLVRISEADFQAFLAAHRDL